MAAMWADYGRPGRFGRCQCLMTPRSAMVKTTACCSWSGLISIPKTWAARSSLVPPAVVAGAAPVVVPLMVRDAAWLAWECPQFRRGEVPLSAEVSVEVLAGLALAFRAGTCTDVCRQSLGRRAPSWRNILRNNRV